jgi:hypothetical protein
MSQINHLKRIVHILRDNFRDDIETTLYWTWNLKNWTIQFTTNYDYESVIAYKAKDELTLWSQYVELEMREKQWVNLL